VDIATNLKTIQEKIIAACGRAGRAPSCSTLVAVAKTHPPETVQAAADAGIVYLGES